ncbi:MAG: hypothetical protein ACFFFH_14465 [Candidatus Thorarchaeota archaeon]
MNKNQLLGLILSLAGAVIGIAGGMILFYLTYEPYWIAELANLGEQGCDIIIRDILPIIADLCIIGGLCFALSAYGFFTDEEWAVSLAVVGNTLCLLAGFWPTIPAMQMGLVPLWGLVFVPNLIIFFIMTHYVDNIPWITVLFALIMGIAYVMAFLNGVASTNRLNLYSPNIDLEGTRQPSIHAIFKGLQRVNWIAAIGFGIATIGILRRPKQDWIRIVALGSAILEVVAGYPVGIASSLTFGKFSMFLMAPILATLLLVVPLWPNLWKRLVSPEGKSPP